MAENALVLLILRCQLFLQTTMQSFQSYQAAKRGFVDCVIEPGETEKCVSTHFLNFEQV